MQGFFRRSQAGPINYQCPRNKNCVIDRVNRNRCQYCRLQKCIALGMSRDAVKFGRMSKKQRERVEDEANQIRMRSSSNNISSPNGLPDYSNITSISQSGNNNDFYTGASYTQLTMTPTNGAFIAYQPGHQPITYASPAPNDGEQVSSEAVTFQQTQCIKPEQMDLSVLEKCLLDAHTRTSLLTEDIEKIKRNTNTTVLRDVKLLDHAQLWAEIAEKLTSAVQQIIEFAKMVPTFMNFLQDDQIMLLKGGSFEIALLRLSRAYDVTSNSVIFGEAFVPLDCFESLTKREKDVMKKIFTFAKDIISLNLTESELAIVCALVLVESDRPGVKDSKAIEHLNIQLQLALRAALSSSHPNEEDRIMERLKEYYKKLHELSALHIEMLDFFKTENPEIDFPALHKELFSPEGLD
ncbi:DgyrCDS1127 [Dimorphilus gyrociliatus]|uniref:DgyrCDS1127 n=1 Tax=Dimorphilus gyrociliatus TaxID=2664684 RepID=A0A7I8V7T1_9ANNE|nr:DgyrCDS1127 [Dimorphilus gyrociliatus]